MILTKGEARAVFGLALILMVSSGVSADDVSNREILRAEVLHHLQVGDENEALQTLGDYLREHREDVEAWKLLGLTYLKVGEREKGQRALRRAASLSTSKRDQDDVKEAIKASNQSERMHGWDGELALSLGYDSNVLLASRNSIVSRAATKVGSPVLLPSAWIQRRFDIEKKELNLGLFSSFTAYTTKNSKPYNTLSVASPVEFWWEQAGQFRKGLRSDFDISFLNSKGLQFYSFGELVSFVGVLEHPNGSRSDAAFGSGYRKYSLTTGADPMTDRSGVPILLTGSHRLGLGEFSLKGELEVEYIYSAGALYRTLSLGLPIRLDFPVRLFSGDLSLTINPSYVRYPEVNASRRDRVFDAALGYQFEVTKRLSLSAGYEYRRSYSTLVDADYQRHTAMIGGHCALF